MNRSKFAANNIHTIVVALTVPFLIAIPARAQEAGSTKSGASSSNQPATESKPTTAGGAESSAGMSSATTGSANAGSANAGSTNEGSTSTASGAGNETAGATDAAPKRKKIIFKPGVPLTITTQNEIIKVTNDAKLAREQVSQFPDSPEAHFVLAVALTRTSQVEEALKEVRNARKLSNLKGGAAYFDQMIQEYEKMLTNYPDDDEVRYHLAWAYYMKAYVLARYSKQVAPSALPTVAAKATANASAAPSAETKTDTKTDKVAAVPSSADTNASVAPSDKGPNWQSDWVSQSSVLTPEELEEEKNEAKAVAKDSGVEGEIGSSKADSKKESKKASKKDGKKRSDKEASDQESKIATEKKDAVQANLDEDEGDTRKAFTPPTVAPANAAPKAGNNNFWANPLGSLTNLGPITGMEYAKASAAPEVIPQVKAYYRRALKKLDEVLERQPDDLWAKLYRAHLGAEYNGDIDSAMKVWETCREAHPNNPAPYFFLGEGYLKKGDLRQCLANVSKAIALRSIGN